MNTQPDYDHDFYAWALHNAKITWSESLHSKLRCLMTVPHQDMATCFIRVHCLHVHLNLFN